MIPSYIIVQAGGKGTRLGPLTVNKPKALVPVSNLPMLFHLFRLFPKARFVVIADYKVDVMRRYLGTFADVKYLVVDATGTQGTCGGLGKALEKIPEEQPFLLIWCDLVLPQDFSLPAADRDYIGLSKGFTCRWRYIAGRFEEIPSSDYGVAGLFWFRNKTSLADVPQEGEFVKWLQERGRSFQTLSLPKTEEYGLFSRFTEDSNVHLKFRCRPFNTIRIGENGTLIKTGIDEQGKELAEREIVWYRHVEKQGFTNIPHIYDYEPLTMERIIGKNIFEYQFNSLQRIQILRKLVDCLRELHALDCAPVDYFSLYYAYLGKTWKRLDKVRELIPFADQRYININGKSCRNVFFYKRELEEKFANYRCKQFVLLHGDSTFSNILLSENLTPVLIDPRGYFGYTELYGDPAYDWAKLYYSIIGNYDQFNRGCFSLKIGQTGVTLEIQSNGWEDMENPFLEMLADEVDKDTICLLHAVIWLSLTTYAWHDYDSVCGAFYNGLFYLEDILQS